MAENFTGDENTTEQLAALPAQPTNHPLYRQIQTLINQGNWAKAQAPLADLLNLYPGDPYLQQLAAAARARSALLGPGEVITVEPIRHDAHKGLNLKLIGLGLAVILLLCMAAGAIITWQFLLSDTTTAGRQTHLEQLRSEAELAFSSGDYDRAVSAYNEVLQLEPNDRQSRIRLEEATQLRATASLYSEAIAEMEAHHWEASLSILQQIETGQPGYRDVAARINFVQQQQNLSARFSEAESAFNQSDYKQAIELYEALQAEDYGFQRDIVQDHLFLSYLQLGLAEEAAAGNNSQQLQAALDKFEKALTLHPDDSQARGESQLIRLYLAGLAEFKAKNWDQAISNLSAVYEAQPDFGNGSVGQLLYEAYVAQGDELFENGQFEQAMAKYKEARLIDGPDTADINQKIALVQDALTPPTPTPEPTPAPPVSAPAVANVGGAVPLSAPVPTPTPTPQPFPYALKTMSVRNNCGDHGYIHGVVWNAYNLPLPGVVVHAFNETTGLGPLISSPTNGDGIYQIIVNKDQIEGLWSVQIFENDQPVSLAWGQHLGGECINGAQELKVDWQRELQLQ